LPEEPAKFTYVDESKPVLLDASAGEQPNELVLIFSKPIKEGTVNRRENYTVVEAGSSRTPQEIASARMDAADKSGKSVVVVATKPFVRDLPYRVEAVTGVLDRSSVGNQVEVPKDFSRPYKDLLPPRIRENGVSANASKLEVAVEFTEPVDRAVAEEAGNYSLIGPDKSELGFVKGAAKLDTAGKRVTLHVVPTKLMPGRYTLLVNKAQDLAKNPIKKPLEDKLEFDATNLKPFAVDKLTGDAGSNQIALTFSRALDPKVAENKANFKLLNSSGGLSDVTITEARRVPEDLSQVRLILSRELMEGENLTVVGAGLSDIFDHKSPQDLSRNLVVGGVGALTEQLLKWVGRPSLKGNTITLVINEWVTKATAMNEKNYQLSSSATSVEKVKEMKTEENSKSGSRSTTITLILRSPLLTPLGVKLSARNLRIENLDIFGNQNLDPVELAVSP
ncbi:MAG TPA: hypothetical protein VM029_03595, partial [Opitutaceae bacterium]|nr:hypothetical protein [Opitutaceae bacterium]